MKKDTILIILVIALLASNIFFGYMFFFHKESPNFRGNFPQMELTGEQIQSVTSFFESTTNSEEITNYCNNNQMECFYYCRNINSDHEFCSQLMKMRPNSPGFQG